MAETNLSLAYRALISSFGQDKMRVLDSGAISSAARSLGLNPGIIRQGLVRGGYLLPVYFNGVYYLLSPNEFKTKFLEKKSFEIVAAACNNLFGRNWYYGLGSALYFGRATHQSPKEFSIITNSHMSASFEFMGNGFKVKKLSAENYSMEIEKQGPIRFSSLARTITDYLYFYSKGGKREYAVGIARDILASFPEARNRINTKLIGIYPRPYNLAVAYAADMVCGNNV